tara:strand:- start:3083 stop:3253 length:171 start_codon:yes stop_codon:yes gene_type:complete
MINASLLSSMFKVTLSPDQIDLITYCLEMEEHNFDEVEQRDYQEILKSFKFPEPAN